MGNAVSGRTRLEVTVVREIYRATEVHYRITGLHPYISALKLIVLLRNAPMPSAGFLKRGDGHVPPGKQLGFLSSPALTDHDARSYCYGLS